MTSNSSQRTWLTSPKSHEVRTYCGRQSDSLKSLNRGCQCSDRVKPQRFGFFFSVLVLALSILNLVPQHGHIFVSLLRSLS
mmetsp:Transcript_75691/g.245215  ORF Transcript_75691/g.245215 Transcript_75691/m.245215 type:complete len:81 (+) Transcript_75691:186-428(+)